MEETDAEFVDRVVALNGNLHHAASVQSFVDRMRSVADVTASTRKNFLFDTTTPHGDLIITESSAMKPGIGWVTVHVTEGIRRGVHEWAVKVDHQGETSDGSGLMLGVVPKNFSKFDSFVSQGGGWCLSRAGKFYGHWRRVDNNTSVSSLVFNTGDRVTFTLDVEAARMTVKVGDRYVVGELSNLTTEVYPAVSLHYRHQHVRMEYHKVHERHAKRLHWIERGTFPAAPLYMPLSSRQISRIPLDVYVFSSVFSAMSTDAEVQRRHAESAALKYPGEVVAENRLSVAIRAFDAVSRYSRAGFGQTEDRLGVELTPEHLRRQAARAVAQSDGSSSFLVNCGALLVVHMLANATPDSAAPLLAGSSLAVAQYIRSLPLFALAETNPRAPIACDVLQVACDNLAALAEKPQAPLAPALHCRLLELLVTIAIQRGSVGDALRVSRLLLAVEQHPDASMSPGFVEWLARLEPLVARRRDAAESLDGRQTAVSHGVIDAKRCDVSGAMSIACDGQCLLVHAATGLHKLALVGNSSSASSGAFRVCCSTRDPHLALQGAVSSSMVLAGSHLLVHTDRMAATGTAFVVYSASSLTPMRTVLCGDVKGWPLALNHAKLTGVCGSAAAASLLAPGAPATIDGSDDSSDGILVLWSTEAAGDVVFFGTLAADLSALRNKHQSKTLSTSLQPLFASPKCLQMGRDTVVVLGYPEGLHFPSGHGTVEMWIRLAGKEESKVFYQHGEKSTSGEVFLETAVHDGVFSFRGGFRHDTRGACSVTAPVSPSSVPQFLHVALVFDGRWRLLINAEEVSATKNFAAQSSFVERPRGKWTCGNGCIGQMAELRVWRCARSRKDIDRDRRRVLRGDEAGLLAYFRMTEERGCTLYNMAAVAAGSGHAYILKGSDTRSTVEHPLCHAGEQQQQLVPSVAAAAPHQASTPLQLRLSQSDVYLRGDLLFLLARSVPYVAGGAVAMCVDARTGTDFHADHFKPSDAIGPATSDASGRLWMLLQTLEVTCTPAMASSAGHAEDAEPKPEVSASAAFPLRSRRVLQHLAIGKPGGPAPRPQDVALWLLAICGCFAEAELLKAPSRATQLFAPLAVDVGRDALRHATLLIQDHFRPLQASNSRKTYTLRDAHSAFVIVTALNSLLVHARVVVECKLDAASLDLPVLPSGGAAGSNGGGGAGAAVDLTPGSARRSSSLRLRHAMSPASPMGVTTSLVTQHLALAGGGAAGGDGPTKVLSLGATLLAVLSDMINEDPAVCALPAGARATASEILRRSVVLLFPGVPTRAQLLNDMLVPSCKLRKASHQALLGGLIDTFTRVTEAIHMLLTGAKGKVVDMTAIATALLHDAAAQCINTMAAAASPTAAATASAAVSGPMGRAAGDEGLRLSRSSADDTRAAAVVSAVATVQLLFLSSSRGTHDGPGALPSSMSSVSTFRVVENLFAFSLAASVRDDTLQYYECLFRLSGDVLDAVATRARAAPAEADACPPLPTAFFTTVVHSAISFLPLLLTPHNAGQLLSLMAALLAKIKDTAAGRDSASSSALHVDLDEATDEPRVLQLLTSVLLHTMGWVSAFMTGIRGVDLGTEPTATPPYRELSAFTPMAGGNAATSSLSSAQFAAGGTPPEGSTPILTRSAAPAGGVASSDACEAFAPFLLHPLLQGGLPGLLDSPPDDDTSDARRTAVEELLQQPQLWRPLMQPADATDRLGGPTIQTVMDHIAATALYLGTDLTPLPVHERRTAMAAMAVACRTVRSTVREAVLAAAATGSSPDGACERAMVDRCDLLLHFHCPRVFSEAALLCLAKRHTGPLQLANRWQWAFDVWSAAKRLRRLATSQQFLPAACVELVADIALRSDLSPHDMKECADRRRSAAALRIRGLEECRRLMHISPRVAAETGALMVRSASSRAANHYIRGVEGCQYHQRHTLQVLTYQVAEEFLTLHSASSTWHEQTVLDTLQQAWLPDDFAFLQAVDVPKHLFARHCAVFDDGAASLRQESVAERTHRMTVRERAKRPPPATSTSVQEDAPKPDIRSTDEEQTAQSWQTLKSLALSAAQGMNDRAAPPTTRLGCQYFMEKLLSEVNSEIQKCLQYASHFYYPNQDRVSDQMMSLCSLVCSIVQGEFSEAFAPSLSALPSVSGLITRLCLYANLSVASSSPAVLVDHAIRTAAIVGARCSPEQCVLRSNELIEFMRSALDETAADRTSLLGYLLAFATRSGLSGDTSAGAGSLATAVRAAHLLVLRPRWGATLRHFAPRTKEMAAIAVSHDRSAAERREAALFLFVVAHAMSGMLTHTVAIGSLLTSHHDTDNGIAELVYVVDVNHTTAMATVIPADLDNITAERDVSVDLLSNPPDSSAQFPPFELVRAVLGPALRVVLGQWIMLCSTVLGNIVGSAFMRIAAVAVERDAATCAEWTGDGTLRKIHDVVARRPLASPLPLAHLREVGAILAHSCIKAHQAGGQSEAVSVFQLVGPDASLMSFQNELVGQGDGSSSSSSNLFSATMPGAAALLGSSSSSSAAAAMAPPPPVTEDAGHQCGLLFLSPTDATISFAGDNEGRKPLIDPAAGPGGGFSLEVTMMLSDQTSFVFGNAFAVPSSWGLPPAYHAIVTVLAADGSPVFSLDVHRDVVVFRVFGAGEQQPSQQPSPEKALQLSRPVGAGFPIAVRDLDAWIHLVAVYDSAGHQLHLYRDGELAASYTLDETERQRVAAKHPVKFRCGGRPASAPAQPASAVLTALKGLRVWTASAIPKALVRTIGDHLRLDVVLPAVPAVSMPCLTFLLLDGTGDTVRNEENSCTGTLHGQMKWLPQMMFPPLDPAHEGRFADDVERCTVPDRFLPRKDIATHVSSLEGPQLPAVGYVVFASLSAHYSRRCILSAIQQLDSDAFKAVCGTSAVAAGSGGGGGGVPHRYSPRDILCRNDVVTCLVNLVRYGETTAVPPADLAAVVQFAVSLLTAPAPGSQLPLSPEHTKSLFASFVREALSLLRRDATEDFVVEIPYTSFVPADAQQYPIAVLNGGSATLSFEGPRHMDYLYVNADRQQKASLAKYPDAQGFWPEVEFSQTWLYLRPTAGVKSSPARLTVHAKSMKPAVAAAVLGALIAEASARLPQCLPILFDQRTVSSLSYMLHAPRGDARTPHLRLLTQLLQTWAQHPTLRPFDQVPMAVVLDKVWVMLCTALRRDRHPAGSLLSVPSNVFPRVLQNAAELAVAGVLLESAWRGEPFASATQGTWRRLIELRRHALDPDDLPADGSLRETTPAKIQTVTSNVTSGVNWRRRGDGIWNMTCDRGCQTARGSVGFVRGRHYMEVRVPFNAGALSVGVVTGQFRGVMEITSSSLGQCAHSWGFDGSRQCRLHNGVRVDFTNRTKWKGKDVIGLLLDLDEGTLCCTHNGKLVGPGYDNLLTLTAGGGGNSTSGAHLSTSGGGGAGQPRTPLYPAFSFSPTGCEVNFGGAPFAMELPAGYLPMEIGQYKVSPTAALATCVTVVDTARRFAALKDDATIDVGLLSGLARAQPDAFSSVEATTGRRGPWSMDLVQFDGRPRLEGSEIRAADTLAVVKGNVAVTQGLWYYEVAIVGDGVLQIGWATAGFAPDVARHKGLGDDAASWAVDGCRMLARHNKQQRSLGRHPWRDGDIIGCFLNCKEGTIGYSFNGQPLRDLHDMNGNGTLFPNVPCAGGMVPAISVDQANSGIIMSTLESICFLPTGFTPIGRSCALRTCIERVYFPQPTAGADQPPPSLLPDAPQPLDGVTPKALRQLLRLAMATMDLSAQGGGVLSMQGAVAKMEAFLRQQLPVLDGGGKLAAAMCLAEGTATLIDAVCRFAALPLGDYDDGAGGAVAVAVHQLRPFTAPTTAVTQLFRFLAATNHGAGENIKLTVNRRRALTIGRAMTTPLHERLTATIFGQIYALVGSKSIAMFCTSKKLWSVAFAGEGADDVGGPYRESIAEMCADIMSDALPLFLPSSNQKNNVGEVRDRFIINPDATKPIHLGMLNFLGKVIAGCVRCAEPLPLYLPSAVWKVLVGEALGLEDIAQVDCNTASAIQFIGDTAAAAPGPSSSSGGGSDDELQDMFPGGFTVTGSAGVEVPLFPGGAAVPISRANAPLFTSMFLHHRLHTECRAQMEALRTGFHRVIPLLAVSSLKWNELEHLVCGLPDFSVADLMASARFEGLTRQDRRVVFLAAVLTDFSPHERALFLRFVSGRERLHSTFRLKILASETSSSSSGSGSGGGGSGGEEYDDEHLPHASTCFFWLSLPNYSAVTVLQAKLLLAIHQCHDIDADFRVREVDEEQTPNLVVRQEQDDNEFEDYSHLL